MIGGDGEDDGRHSCRHRAGGGAMCGRGKGARDAGDASVRCGGGRGVVGWATERLTRESGDPWGEGVWR
jgi:hypothetical protein